MALFFSFGLDLYQRKNPKVSLNKEMGEYSITKLSNSNFTLAYRIEDDEGQIFNDESIITQKVFFYSYELIDGIWNSTLREIIERKKCEDFENFKEKEEFFNVSLKNWYCIDFENRTWGGNWDGDFVHLFQIIVEQCINSTENNNTCSSEEKISNSFISLINSGNLYYSQMSMSVQPSMNDFARPLKPYLVNYYQTLNLDLSKSRVQTFKITSVNNDIGWFFNDVKIDSILDMDYAEHDINIKKRWEEPILFSTLFYLGNNKSTYYRTYTEIQEVIASVGGFAKFFYTCLLLAYFYVQKTYRNLILMNSLKFNIETHSKKTSSKGNIKFQNEAESVKKETHIRKPKVDVEVKFSNYICFILCRKRYRSSLNKKLSHYRYYDNYISNKFEVVSYLNLYREFENVKNIILSEEQIRYVKESLPKIIPKENDGENDESSQKQPLQYTQNFIIKE
jgi:hypothetical protein